MSKEQGKYSQLIQSAKNHPPAPSPPSSPSPASPESPAPSACPSAEKRVNLCIKVPASLRRHWSIQAKIQNITMTEVMMQALQNQFGLPDD